jgi:hypothetical protein
MQWYRFRLWRDGVVHALEGGLWLHPFELRGECWAHLVSADRQALLRVGERLAMSPEWLQYRPLKHPATGIREPAWHWDLRGPRLDLALRLVAQRIPAGSPPDGEGR